jgi:hypothetical protein
MKTPVMFVVSGVSEENTSVGARCQFVSGFDREIRMAGTTEHTQVLIGGGDCLMKIEKLSGQYLSLICDESLISRGLNLNPGYSDGSTILSYSCGESRLFVSWCAGGRCGMAGSNKNHGRSRRPSTEDQGWSSTGRVMMCAVCIVHEKTRSASFLVELQNQDRQFVSGLSSKSLGWFIPVWPQNRWHGFLGLGLKISSFGLII